MAGKAAQPRSASVARLLALTPLSETVTTLSRTTSERRIGYAVVVVDLAERVDPAGAADAEADGALLERDHTRPVLGQKRNAWWSCSASDQPGPSMLRVEPRRLAQVGDVEDRELRPERAPVLVRVLADAEQEVLADRVQVGGVAGDLQLAEHARAARVCERSSVKSGSIWRKVTT